MRTLLVWLCCSLAMAAQAAERISFACGSDTCVGYLHRPAVAGPVPVVLMGNGMGTEQGFGSAPFVAAFNQAGFAAFTFDYRYFGESSGQPRQLVDIQAQLEDWRSALTVLARQPGLDMQRLALWGSSLGGGHALSIAAERADVRAVVAQVPYMDSRASREGMSPGDMIWRMGQALWDGLRGLLGLSPSMVPLVGVEGEGAMMSWAGWQERYLRLVPPGSGWRNEVPARSLLTMASYNPVEVIDRIRAPVLLVYGRQDEGVPAPALEEASRRMADVRLAPFDGGHFDVYDGPLHPAALQAEVDFLVEKLSP